MLDNQINGYNNMGRRTSGGFRRASPSPGPSRSTRAAAAPPPQSAPTQQRPGMMSGLGGTLMQGMAFGAGSEVAHQAVRGIMGSGSGSGHQESYNQPSQPVNEPCYQQNQDFMSCLQFNKNDIGMCQNYLDLFKQCKGQF
jgi:coiled-coil-helix-coiled-coil-helix domain-containing protein 2